MSSSKHGVAEAPFRCFSWTAKERNVARAESALRRLGGRGTVADVAYHLRDTRIAAGSYLRASARARQVRGAQGRGRSAVWEIVPAAAETGGAEA